MIAIEFDTKELQTKLNGLAGTLSGKQMNRAIYLGVNKTAKQTRTQSDREIRKVYNIRQQFTLKHIKIKNAHAGKDFAEIALPTKPVPIGEFLGVKGGRGVRKSKPVTVEMIKGKRFTLKGAFLLQSKYNNQGSRLAVMHRSNVSGGQSYSGGEFQFRHKRINPTGKDLTIGAMFSVSPFSSVFNKIVRQQIVRIGEMNLQKNIFEMLDKSVSGFIKAAKHTGRPFRR